MYLNDLTKEEYSFFFFDNFYHLLWFFLLILDLILDVLSIVLHLILDIFLVLTDLLLLVFFVLFLGRKLYVFVLGIDAVVCDRGLVHDHEKTGEDGSKDGSEDVDSPEVFAGAVLTEYVGSKEGLADAHSGVQ